MSRCNTCPPSLIPPWHRPPVSPITHTLVDEGAVSLNTNTTYLDSTTPKDSEDLSVPLIATIGAPLYPQQRKTIMIPAATVATTAVWKVTGSFVGFVSLLFNDLATVVELVASEDGYWEFLGGSALKQDS
jgi:hypothetical protein